MEVNSNALKTLVNITHKNQWFDVEDFAELFVFNIKDAGIEFHPTPQLVSQMLMYLLELNFIEYDKSNIFKVKIKDMWYGKPV
jgi:hypothetical protein